MAKLNIDKGKKNLQLKLAVAKYYKLITAVLVIALLALSYYFILEPEYRKLREGGEYNLETLKSDLAQRKKYLEGLKTLIANYQKINQADVEKLKQILPEEKDIAGLFIQLQALAEKNNLLLAGVSINDSAEDKGTSSKIGKIKRLSLSLNLVGGKGKEGDYNKIKEFLASLESNLRLFDVDAVFFSPDSPAYSVNIFTYYLVK